MKRISAIALVAVLLLATVQMAGAESSSGNAQLTTGICTDATVGVSATDVNFGNIYAGGTKDATSTISVSETPGNVGQTPCEYKSISVTLSIITGSWSNTIGTMNTVVNSIVPNPVVVDSIIPATSTASFTLTTGETVPAGVYTQTITITGIY